MGFWSWQMMWCHRADEMVFHYSAKSWVCFTWWVRYIWVQSQSKTVVVSLLENTNSLLHLSYHQDFSSIINSILNEHKFPSYVSNLSAFSFFFSVASLEPKTILFLTEKKQTSSRCGCKAYPSLLITVLFNSVNTQNWSELFLNYISWPTKYRHLIRKPEDRDW